MLPGRYPWVLPGLYPWVLPGLYPWVLPLPLGVAGLGIPSSRSIITKRCNHLDWITRGCRSSTTDRLMSGRCYCIHFFLDFSVRGSWHVHGVGTPCTSSCTDSWTSAVLFFHGQMRKLTTSKLFQNQLTHTLSDNMKVSILSIGPPRIPLICLASSIANWSSAVSSNY